MTVAIHWEAFFQVLGAALVGTLVVVGFYALGLRMLVLSGRSPVVTPAEFTDAITVISDKEAKRATKAASPAGAYTQMLRVVRAPDAAQCVV